MAGLDLPVADRDQQIVFAAEAVALGRLLEIAAFDHQPEIDVLIEEHSHNWRLERMQRIDRNVLRIGVFELKYATDIPRKVTINEAVELAKNFGNEASSAFINGLLDKIAGTVGKA